MPYIFSYGTLQQQEIQHELFLRELKGWSDEIVGFELCMNKAYGKYPIIMKSSNKSVRIVGMVYEVSNEELKKADIYEGDAYMRTIARTISGKEAWTYIAK